MVQHAGGTEGWPAWENRLLTLIGNPFYVTTLRLFDGIRILAQIIHPELFNELLNVDLAKCVSV